MRRMTGRRGLLPAIVTTLAAIALLAGTGRTAEAQKKISVLTWNIPVYKEKIDGWIADFKQIHPDVQVEWLDKKGTEWATFYQTQLVGGTAPDVIDVQGGLWLEYAANGGLVDLTPYLAREPQVRDYYNPKFMATWVYQGKQYMVPFYVSKTLLFYNKTLFKEAGLTRPPQSFDELIDYARKMTKGEKSGLVTLNFDWLYWPLFAMNGVELLAPDGKKAAFNTPAAVKTLEALARATEEGRHQQGELDRPLGGEQRRVRRGHGRPAPRPRPRLLLRPRRREVGEPRHAGRRAHARRLRHAQLPRVRHLEVVEASRRRVGLRQADHEREVGVHVRHRRSRTSRAPRPTRASSITSGRRTRWRPQVLQTQVEHLDKLVGHLAPGQGR